MASCPQLEVRNLLLNAWLHGSCIWIRILTRIPIHLQWIEACGVYMTLISLDLDLAQPVKTDITSSKFGTRPSTSLIPKEGLGTRLITTYVGILSLGGDLHVEKFQPGHTHFYKATPTLPSLANTSLLVSCTLQSPGYSTTQLHILHQRAFTK